MGECWDRVASTYTRRAATVLQRILHDSGGTDADGEVGFPVQAVCAAATGGDWRGTGGIRWAELFTAE